ncbi:5239_t:CDS:2 [Funneliformis mosseae]|uniref:5239_t:CDS:1 n=1 Tax=Funneliformis mosseae TaxID=27381 RepID=A0A9N9C7D4_FUNMO|nr:5239_t:CDS:2 [Funneliformis mosseae]
MAFHSSWMRNKFIRITRSTISCKVADIPQEVQFAIYLSNVTLENELPAFG